MKKIIFLLPLLLSFMGCSLDHDGDSQQPIYRLVPIVATNLPETFTAGETYEVEMTYVLPTSCHRFFTIQNQNTADVHLFGILASVTQGSDCQETEQTGIAKFDLLVEPKEMYTFKFWQGVENGQDIYLTVEVPVENAPAN